jgi:hypothetical protein
VINFTTGIHLGKVRATLVADEYVFGGFTLCKINLTNIKERAIIEKTKNDSLLSLMSAVRQEAKFS